MDHSAGKRQAIGNGCIKLNVIKYLFVPGQVGSFYLSLCGTSQSDGLCGVAAPAQPLKVGARGIRNALGLAKKEGQRC